MNLTKFWAIGDTHLSFARPRDQERFGEKWRNYVQRIADNWRKTVHTDDVVLLLGDVSWANTPKKVRPDLAWLAELPGRKVMVRGNHDRWWRNIDDVRGKILPPGFFALQGDTLEIDGVLLCGAQGHIAPNDPYYRPDPPHNRYEREIATLQAGIEQVAQVRQNGQPLIVMLHYPPFTSDAQPTAFSAMIEQVAPAQCLYGHLHRASEWEVAITGQERHGIKYRLLAADFVDMMLQQVWPEET